MQSWVCLGVHPPCAVASPGPVHAAIPEGDDEIRAKKSRGRGHPKCGGWEKRWKEIMPFLKYNVIPTSFAVVQEFPLIYSVETPVF